jgi:hypothetical protein
VNRKPSASLCSSISFFSACHFYFMVIAKNYQGKYKYSAWCDVFMDPGRVGRIFLCGAGRAGLIFAG